MLNVVINHLFVQYLTVYHLLLINQFLYLPMQLAFNLLLIILTELPIIGFFFRKRKRKNALIICLFVNIVTWPVINIIRLNTNFNLDMVQIFVVIAEGLGYWLICHIGWKKGFLISVLANAASFIITKFVYLPPDFFQKKIDIIR